MINEHEAYVSSDLAILLRQAGFNWKVTTYYLRETEVDGDDIVYGKKFNLVENEHFCNDWNHDALTMSSDGTYLMRVSAPTIDMARSWLREIFNFHIAVTYDTKKEPYPFTVMLDHHTCPMFDDEIVWNIYWSETELKSVYYSDYRFAEEAAISAYAKFIIPAKEAMKRLKNK